MVVVVVVVVCGSKGVTMGRDGVLSVRLLWVDRSV